MWYTGQKANNAVKNKRDTNPVDCFVDWVLMALSVGIKPLLHCWHDKLFAHLSSDFTRKYATLRQNEDLNPSKMNSEDKWQTLREKLEMDPWPRLYMFKFIVPADNERIALVEKLFDTREAQVNMRTSKKGNYVSITAKEIMLSPDHVIARYKSAEGIDGLISL